MRVTVVGNSGSGKSTLARRLGERCGLATLDLDTVAWEPGKVAAARAHGVAVAELEAFCRTGEGWVVEGCYAGLASETLRFGPLLVFLDPGVEACLANCRSRPWEPHKYATAEAQDENLEFLLQWVREYYSREDDLSLAAHRALFHRYGGPKLRLEGPADAVPVERVTTLLGEGCR